ncbi:cystathione beta-lyase [Nitrosomonas cryotolerans]|uniref:cysteine-S-conjugate beta-lyase n=1 Tax=Nitrosomonas cryotolerans ATCC 49181 TaxID=1131553 RepID=A0A1N6J369_9PROT|nr:pyridoxal phosphate-dependent aminotransferase [Nitrosomonas cryotolerans]SFP92627.1 cystathione beta-lyase [Nitrosomonas cryotolerans]SIO38712.1 cystathione beta-lyase [Nitrosomonas cryotolerans ATCC 49181]
MSDSFGHDLSRKGTDSLKYDGRQNIFGTDDVIPLWVADMDFATPPAVTQALVERARHPIYGYTLYPDSLYDATVDWLQRRHNWSIQHDWIVMCPGVVSSLNAAVMAFTASGDSVIIQPPVYFPFFTAVTQTGRKLIQNPLHLEKGRYTIDFDHLEQCAKQAHLLLLCSPHNPVGRVWHESELKRLLQIAEQYDLIIFSDEIHADLVYPGNKHHTLAAFNASHTPIITAIAPSKTFNIPGLNLSALVIPDEKVRAAIKKIFDTLHISASNPFSIVAFEAAYRKGEAWLEALLIYLRDTRDYVAAFLNDHLPKIKLIGTEGTYLLWLDCRALNMNDRQLQHFFIHQAKIGMSPGTLFGNEGSGFMRLNIGAPRQTIMTALENIKQASKELD